MTDDMPAPSSPEIAGERASPARVLSTVQQWSQSLLPALGLTAIAAYTLLLIWYRSFYGYFGLTPRDVGLNQETVLTQAAAAALTLIGIVFVLVAPRRALAGPVSPLPVWQWPLIKGTVFFTVLALCAAISLPGRAALLILVLVLAALWFGPFVWHRLRRRPQWIVPPATAGRMVLGYALSLLFIAGTIALQINGLVAAEDLANDRETGLVSYLLDIRAPHVDVTSHDGTVPAWAPGGNFLLLGSGDGQLRLYDLAKRRAVSVDAGTVVLSTRVRG